MRIMRDAVGSQNLIPGHKSYILRVRRIYDLCSGITPILSFTDHLHVLSFACLFSSTSKVLLIIESMVKDSTAEMSSEAITRVAIPRIFNKVA